MHCQGRKNRARFLQFGSHFSLLVVETFAEKELLETPELFEAPFSEEEHTTGREDSKELFPAAERGKILRTPNWLTSSLVNGGEERRNGELTKNGLQRREWEMAPAKNSGMGRNCLTVIPRE